MSVAKRQAKPEPLMPAPLIGREEMNLAEFPMRARTDYEEKLVSLPFSTSREESDVESRTFGRT